MRAPKVSVVVPTYQRASFLHETVTALLSQTLTDIEVIVADDGSTDCTRELMAQFVDQRLRYLPREHLGMPGILNEAIAVARGEYIMTCHDHDIYDATLLQELADILDRNPTATFAHCGTVNVDPTARRELERHVRDHQELTPGKRFLAEVLLPGLASPVSALTMVRAAALDGKALDPRFGQCADVELWLRLSTVGDVAYVRKPLIRIRQRDESSHLYQADFKLAGYSLEAKKLYLPVIGDQVKQRHIEVGWRAEANSAGLLALLKALEHRRYDEVRAIRDFVSREGSFAGGVVVTSLTLLPTRGALLVLKTARTLIRLAKSPGRGNSRVVPRVG